jgi:hypothetical protein
MLKSHELSHKGHPDHDASFTSKALITSARFGGHDANPTNAVSSALEFALPSLVATSNEQYESISEDEIALLARKFHALNKFHKERRRSCRGYFKCDDTTHFITDCPKRKKFYSSNVTPDFKTKTKCSSYVCPGSICHIYGQNVSTEYQCLYYIVSYYRNLLQVQKGLNSRMDPILPQAVDRGFRTPRRSLHQHTPHLLSNRA